MKKETKQGTTFIDMLKYTISSQVVHCFQQGYLVNNQNQAPEGIQYQIPSERRENLDESLVNIQLNEEMSRKNSKITINERKKK